MLWWFEVALLRQTSVTLAVLVVGFFLLGAKHVSLDFDPKVLPLGGFLLVAFLGARINQTRVTALALCFALAFAALTGQMPDAWDGLARLRGTELSSFIAISLPMTACILSLFGTVPFFSAKGAFVTGLALSPTLALLWASLNTHLTGRLFGMELLPFGLDFGVPDVAVYLAVVYLAVSALRRDAQTIGFDIATTLAFVPLFYALHSGPRAPAAYALFLAASAVMMLYAVFNLYTERVYTDDLCRVPNRRALNEYLKGLSGRYSIAMVDVDRFKRFNDRHGHTEGDHALRFVAHHLARTARGKVFRYGGEEFCVVYPGLVLDEALERAESTQKSLSKRKFFIRSRKSVRKATTKKDRGRLDRSKKQARVTISVGVAQRESRGLTAEAVVAKADKALYKAKKNGRNRVERSK